MYSEYVDPEHAHAAVRLPIGLELDRFWSDRDDWDEPQPNAVPDELWEVFVLDEETMEPEPEYGDFPMEADQRLPI